MIPKSDQVQIQSIPKSLSIVLPAFNEEDAIGSSIERCLKAQLSIQRRTPIEHIEIIVVSDGSTDRTAEIARSYEGVSVVYCEENHGYGAALKLGFKSSSGDLVGFLDADGTCDPEFLVDLCNLAIEGPADVVLGSRMHKESKMPAIRKVGNWMYAVLMSYLSDKRVTDTTSGMRVIRREALQRLNPLPDGLHFSLAISSRALLSDGVTIREIPMPYFKRKGNSKLKILKDGMRFFLTIGEHALTYRPLKLFCGVAALLSIFAFLYGLAPIHTYLVNHFVPDYFIYRLIAVNTLILAALMFLTVGIVAERVAGALNGGKRQPALVERFLLGLFSGRKMLVAGPVVVLLGILLNLGTIRDYLTTWSIEHHWVYVTTGALLVLGGMQLTALGILDRLIGRIVMKDLEEPAEKGDAPCR
jgi:glycosyltransferase involved in cell wall biosynthesis